MPTLKIIRLIPRTLAPAARSAIVLWAASAASCAASGGTNEVSTPAQLSAVPATPLVVVVAQPGVKTTHFINPGSSSSTGCPNCPGGAAGAALGGIVAGLIVNKMQAAQQKSAAEFLDQVGRIDLVLLKSYDFNANAAASAQSMAPRVPWLSAAPAQVTTEDTNAAFTQLLDSSDSPQMLAVRYGYTLISELKALELETDIALLDRRVPMTGKPTARASFKGSLFLKHVNYRFPLQDATDDAVVNAKRWAKDSAKAFCDAMDTLLEKSSVVTSQALLQSPAATGKTPRGSAQDHAARPILYEDEQGILFAESPQKWVYEFSPAATTAGADGGPH
jgi:hypothetical protein